MARVEMSGGVTRYLVGSQIDMSAVVWVPMFGLHILHLVFLANSHNTFDPLTPLSVFELFTGYFNSGAPGFTVTVTLGTLLYERLARSEAGLGVHSLYRRGGVFLVQGN